MRISRLIVDHVLEQSKGRPKGENVFHATDLCRCPLKRIYELQFPELARPFAPQLVTGQIVHLGLQHLLREREFKIEVEKSRRIGEYTIIGRIDALNERDRLGVEIKFSRDDKYLPYEHHVLQVKIYNWLFDLDKTILVYVTPERITEFEVHEALRENQVESLILDEKTPKYDWECRYCEFSVICPKKRC